MRIHVLGAGVAGLCVANELIDRGLDVTLIEQAERVGKQACSWWAGGMLAPWCEGESAEPVVTRLGQSAADWWEQHGVEVRRRGTLAIVKARDQGDIRLFSLKTQGYDEVTAAAIAALEPDLEGRFLYGLFYPQEAHLTPREALSTLLARVEQSGRVQFGDTGPDTGPGDNSSPAPDWIVDARGLAARDRLPDLRGVKGEMLIVSCPDVSLTRSVRLLHPRIPLYLVPRGDGVYMLGATMIESDDRERLTARAMVELLQAAYAIHPAFAEAEILEIGVDARPAFPDNLPRVVRDGNTLYVNGLYRHGFLLAPALARMTADLVLEPTRHPEFFHEYRG